MSPEESLGWRYTFGSYGSRDAIKPMILDKITKGRSVQRALGPRTGTAAFRSCNKKVPAKKHNKDGPER